MLCAEDFVWRECKKNGAEVWCKGFKAGKVSGKDKR
jgi:hypothetical protein